MISKEELLKQKTKESLDMENLEDDIDSELRKIMPDTINNNKIKIDVYARDYNFKIIKNTLDKYITLGNYKSTTCYKEKKGLTSERLFIVFEL